MLISVGLPQRPDSAGNGGRSRGIPRRPSTEAISAVLFAADKRAGAFDDAHAQRETGAQQRRAQPAAFFQLRNRRPHAPDRQRIFVADIENALVRADGHRRQGQPLDDAEGKRFQNHAVHERARIAFVAVADHIFDIARLLADGAPFLAGGKSRPAASAQAGLFDGGDELFGGKAGRFFRRAFQAPPERGEAVMGEVFIQVQRIEFAEMFGGDMDLVFQEGADGGIAFAHGEARHLLLRRGLLQQQAVQQARPEPAGAAQKTARAEMPLHERAGLAGRQVGIVSGRLARQRDFNHRRAMAHAHATHALDADLAAALARAFAQGVKQLVAALGHAAGTEADVDLGGAVGGRRFHFLGGLRAVPRAVCRAR